MPEDTECNQHEGEMVDPNGNVLRFDSPMEGGVSPIAGLRSPRAPKVLAPVHLRPVGTSGDPLTTALARLGHLGVKGLSTVDLLEMAIRIARGGEFEHG